MILRSSSAKCTGSMDKVSTVESGSVELEPDRGTATAVGHDGFGGLCRTPRSAPAARKRHQPADGRDLLQSERNAMLMIDVLRSYVAARKFRLHDFVVMPDHLH